MLFKDKRIDHRRKIKAPFLVYVIITDSKRTPFKCGQKYISSGKSHDTRTTYDLVPSVDKLKPGLNLAGPTMSYGVTRQNS